MNHTSSSSFCLGSMAILFLSPVAQAQEPAAASPVPVAQSAAAQDNHATLSMPNSPGKFGLGLNIGNELTGVTAKLWAASTVAFQPAVGERVGGNNIFTHIDLLFCPSTWTSSDGQYTLPVYLGWAAFLAAPSSAALVDPSTN